MKSQARPAPSAWQLQRVVALAQATVDNLRSEHGVILDTDEAIVQALAEEQVDVGKVLHRLVEAQIQAAANARIAGERKAALDVRIARFARQDQAIRQTIVDVLEALDVKSWPDPEFSLTVTPGRSRATVTDAKAIPLDLTIEVPASRVPDMPAIKAKLAANEDVAGVTVSNGAPILTIRTR